MYWLRALPFSFMACCACVFVFIVPLPAFLF
jgi:hypothetical protein